MTELNQRISAITREIAETGEPVRVTNRGRVVLRLIPEPAGDGSPIESIIAAGLASAPSRERHEGPRPRVELSAPIDEVLSELDREW